MIAIRYVFGTIMVLYGIGLLILMFLKESNYLN